MSASGILNYSTQELIAELTKRRAETFGRIYTLVEQVDSPNSVATVEAEIRDNAEILDEADAQFLLRKLSLTDRAISHDAYMAAIAGEFERLDFGIPPADVMRQWCINDQPSQAYKSDAGHQFDRCGLNYWQVRKFYCWLKSRR